MKSHSKLLQRNIRGVLVFFVRARAWITDASARNCSGRLDTGLGLDVRALNKTVCLMHRAEKSEKDFVFAEFELLHSSKTRNISVIGSKFSKLERKYPLLFSPMLIEAQV